MSDIDRYKGRADLIAHEESGHVSPTSGGFYSRL